MKIITTTREYDEQGRLVKETVMETETPDAPAPIYYLPQQTCTCNTSGWCPLHGQQWGWWQSPIICGGSVGVTPDHAVTYN